MRPTRRAAAAARPAAAGGRCAPSTTSASANQSAQALGLRTYDTATTASVNATAIPAARHSRRTTNHSQPTPGVIFVRTGNAHTTGARSATTNAAASRKWMFPTHSS